MSEAINNPVRARRSVTNTDFEQKQLDVVDMDGGSGQQIIETDTGVLFDDALAQLAFNEEPVTIIIARGTERYAPEMVQCWVNGKGAEVLSGGKWITLSWLPTAKEVTTKRKYVEVLLRSKPINYTTEVTQYKDHEINEARPHLSSAHTISVIADRNPLGREWLNRVMWEN